MIRRETSDDQICVLTFDRPDSGANIFDAATLDELNEQLDGVEKDASLRGLILASAKKSIFVAGADLKTLLQGARTGEMREFIERGQQVFNRLANLGIPTVAAIHGASVRNATNTDCRANNTITPMGAAHAARGMRPISAAAIMKNSRYPNV